MTAARTPATSTVHPASSRQRERVARLSLIALAAALAAFYLLTLSGHFYARDEEELYYVAEGLVEGRGFTIPADVPLTSKQPGADGQFYSQYPPGQAIAAIPLYLLGKLVASGVDEPLRPHVTRLYVLTFNVWVTAALCALFARTALLFGASLRLSLLLAGLLGFTTMQWVYARTFFAEPLTQLLLLASLFGIARGARRGAAGWLALSGLAAGLALTVKPHAALTWPALALYLGLTLAWPAQRWQRPDAAWWQARGPVLLRGLGVWLAGLLPGVAFQAAYNWAVFHNPLATGYTAKSGIITFDAPFATGLYGLTLSSGKGLVFFAPLVVAGLAALPAFARRQRWLALAIGLAVVLHLIFFSPYRAWYGGGSWGPRFMLLILTPLLLPLAVWLRRAAWRSARLVTVVLLALAGLWVQLTGVWVNFDTPFNLVEDAPRFFMPNASPIVLQARLAAERWAQWQAVLLPRSGTATVVAGFSRAGLANESASVLPVRALPELVLVVRPAAPGPLTLDLTITAPRPVQVLWDGAPVPGAQVATSADGAQRLTASLPATGQRHDLRLIQPGLAGSKSEDLPLVTDLRLHGPRGDLALVQWPYIPPMPASPFQRWQWFQVPNIPHLVDHWLWYLYAAGIGPRAILVIATPLLLASAALAGVAAACLWRIHRLQQGAAPVATPLRPRLLWRY